MLGEEEGLCPPEEECPALKLTPTHPLPGLSQFFLQEDDAANDRRPEAPAAAVLSLHSPTDSGGAPGARCAKGGR